VNDAPQPAADVIRVAGVTKVYQMGRNAVHALRGIDLTVKRGEMIAIMGQSGSGKSTLMNVLGCLDQPTTGTYFLDGVRVNGLTKNELADLRNQKLGFVFQGFNLLARTSALENVELPLLYDRSGRWRDTRALAQKSLERVGLGARVEHHPSEHEPEIACYARRIVEMRDGKILRDEPVANRRDAGDDLRALGAEAETA
jgi:putative ABC transport system ATP-binding protein